MLQTVIKPLAKGQVTIPVSFRKALKIKENTLFTAELKSDGIFLKPLRMDWTEKYIRDFTDEEIEEWLREDVLDTKTRNKIKKYL